MKKTGSSKQGEVPDFKSVLQRAAHLCSRQEQCSGQIREKLLAWGLSPEDSEKVITLLVKEQFLDDRRYASVYVKDKFRFNGWGRIKITHMLKNKQLDGEIIASALEEIDEEAWYRSCLDQVKRKSATLRDTNMYTRKGKLFRFASGRGFEPDLVHRAIREAGEKGS
jgi:regulatory protein